MSEQLGATNGDKSDILSSDREVKNSGYLH